MRGFSGAIAQGGAIRVGPVTLPDLRRDDLRELLVDLSRPGLCLVLGAGASHGVIPMRPSAIAALAKELLEAGGVSKLHPRLQRQLSDHPEVVYMTELLRRAPTDAWDRMLNTMMRVTHSEASFLLNDVFRPQSEVPSALTRIYSTLENARGVIVTYNYDRITDPARTRFRIIAPHGERSKLFDDPQVREEIRRMTMHVGVPFKNDWWLPVPETVEVQYRAAYQQALAAWRQAATIVFIGYGFGGGADAFSYEDFGRNAAPKARVHVLCPPSDNRDLCKTVGHALRGRGARFRVFEQPYRWRALAEAVLEYLDSVRATHIVQAVGAELEIAWRHDRR